MEGVILEVSSVKTSYKNFKISNISFKLKSEDIFGLVGRSGSGKSTIMKTLLGLKKADSGKIKAAVNQVIMPLKNIIGYSPQYNSLFPFLTLDENLMTFGKLQGMEKNVIKQRSDNILKRLDLHNSRKKLITELSGGMQKRADLAITLIHDPKIIILDEPFTGLDISLQKFIWELLKELAKDGKIIIISSHILADIQRYCNEFGLVENGQFFNTAQIAQTLSKSKEKTLEFFLEKLFTRDLMQDE